MSFNGHIGEGPPRGLSEARECRCNSVYICLSTLRACAFLQIFTPNAHTLILILYSAASAGSCKSSSSWLRPPRPAGSSRPIHAPRRRQPNNNIRLMTCHRRGQHCNGDTCWAVSCNQQSGVGTAVLKPRVATRFLPTVSHIHSLSNPGPCLRPSVVTCSVELAPDQGNDGLKGQVAAVIQVPDT